MLFFYLPHFSNQGYLKIITPKAHNETRSGKTTIVYGEVRMESKPMSNWTGKNLDPDSVKKHYNNLNRAGFRGNRDAKGIF